MDNKYTFPKNESNTVRDDTTLYTQGITIPITLPSTGNYSVEDLKKELTDFAMRLLRLPATTKQKSQINWRDLTVSDRVKSMSLGPIEFPLECDDKDILIETLDEKYK